MKTSRRARGWAYSPLGFLRRIVVSIYENQVMFLASALAVLLGIFCAVEFFSKGHFLLAFAVLVGGCVVVPLLEAFGVPTLPNMYPPTPNATTAVATAKIMTGFIT